MRKHVPILISLCLALGLHAVAIGGTFQQATATRTYDRGHVGMERDGKMRVRIDVSNASGRRIDAFEVHVPVSGAIVDGDGNVLAASVPAGLATDRDAVLTRIDNLVDNAAAAGKFAR